MSGHGLITVPQLNEEPTGSVIFLHGSATKACLLLTTGRVEDSGDGIRVRINKELGKEWQFPHLRILYPTAPVSNYTPLGGDPANVWFDRLKVSPAVPECLESIEASMRILKQVIDQEIQSGIPLERILIGGFSMGGAMALHLTYRMFHGAVGCFTISSFLNDSSVVYEYLETNTEKPLPPLSMMHGDSDELVPMEWGIETLKRLQKLGVDGTMTIEKNVPHDLCKDFFVNLTQWINMRVPFP